MKNSQKYMQKNLISCVWSSIFCIGLTMPYMFIPKLVLPSQKLNPVGIITQKIYVIYSPLDNIHYSFKKRAVINSMGLFYPFGIFTIKLRK